MNNMYTLENKVKYISQCEYKYFLNKANVVGVGLGYKITRGFSTCRKCITVLVSRKMSENNLLPQDIIPRCYKGIETDIVQSGYLRLTKLTKKIRPVPGGYSIGPAATRGGGSMGCVVTDNHSNYILSCNHVIASNNDVPIGTPILQPARVDGGKAPDDTVGALSEFVPIKWDKDNYVDAGIARILNKKNVSSSIALVGKINGTVSAKLNEKVKKVGKITELTTGKVTILNVTFDTMIKGKKCTFIDQIVTTKMTAPGDSGCVLLNNKDYVIGLAMAEGDDITAYNNFQRVLNSMNVLLVTD